MKRFELKTFTNDDGTKSYTFIDNDIILSNDNYNSMSVIVTSHGNGNYTVTAIRNNKVIVEFYDDRSIAALAVIGLMGV